MDVVVSISKSCPLCTGITHLVYAMAICAKFRSFFFESDSSRFYQLDMSYFFFFIKIYYVLQLISVEKFCWDLSCVNPFFHTLFSIYSFYVLEMSI